MIDARKLDRSITVERRTSTLNADREEVTAWSPVAALAAQRLENGSREFVRAYGEAEEGSAVFRIRFTPGITVADRIVFDGEALELVEVVELGRRSGMDLRAKVARP